MRIVSLIASATEIVSALGFEDQLVARSHECDYPEGVRRLPAVTQPRFDIQGSSAEIDRRVKEALRDAVSVYQVDQQQLKALRPDVIVTQSHCEVCAVSLKDVERAVCEWLEGQPRIVALHPNGLADLWAGIRQVAEALEAPHRGQQLIARLEHRLHEVSRQAQEAPERPTVACIEWIEPMMSAGNWMPELVELAGGANLFGQAGQHSPFMTWQQLVERDPDVIAVLPCGWDIAKSRSEMPALTRQPEWPQLKAVRNGRVYLTDGNQYFNRPGPRLVESLEILAELLHPGVRFGHEGKAWERFD